MRVGLTGRTVVALAVLFANSRVGIAQGETILEKAFKEGDKKNQTLVGYKSVEQAAKLRKYIESEMKWIDNATALKYIIEDSRYVCGGNNNCPIFNGEYDTYSGIDEENSEVFDKLGIDKELVNTYAISVGTNENRARSIAIVNTSKPTIIVNSFERYRELVEKAMVNKGNEVEANNARKAVIGSKGNYAYMVMSRKSEASAITVEYGLDLMISFGIPG